MARLTAEQRLEKAKKSKALAEAQIKQASAKLRAEDRKKDARRKIVLGGAIIGRAANDPKWVNVLQTAIRGMPEKDRALFEGWNPKAQDKPQIISISDPKGGQDA